MTSGIFQADDLGGFSLGRSFANGCFWMRLVEEEYGTRMDADFQDLDREHGLALMGTDCSASCGRGRPGAAGG
jgi:hypothetical protein